MTSLQCFVYQTWIQWVDSAVYYIYYFQAEFYFDAFYIKPKNAAFIAEVYIQQLANFFWLPERAAYQLPWITAELFFKKKSLSFMFGLTFTKLLERRVINSMSRDLKPCIKYNPVPSICIIFIWLVVMVKASQRTPVSLHE